MPDALLIVGAAAGALALSVAFTVHRARRAEETVPPEGEFAEVDGALLHYVDRGRREGPPLVLIHGLGGTLGNFTHSLVARLEDDFRVVVVDRPGAGHSVRAKGAEASPLGDAAAVAGLLRVLGLERPLLVGHSLGGAVSLAMALDDPDGISGLALISPLSGRRDVPAPLLALFRGISRLLRGVFGWTMGVPLAVLLRPAFLRVAFAPEPVAPDFGSAGGGDLIFRPRALVNASRDAVSVPAAMERIVDRYGEIQIPVGILYGTGDQILEPEDHGRAMVGRIPDLELEVVEGGHMLPISQPDVAATFVRRVAARVR